MDNIQIYGTDWCEDTQQTREHLDVLGIPYDYIDIDEDTKAQEWVEQQNYGRQKTPTIRVGEQVLVEPSNDELDRALRGTEMIQ